MLTTRQAGEPDKYGMFQTMKNRMPAGAAKCRSKHCRVSPGNPSRRDSMFIPSLIIACSVLVTFTGTQPSAAEDTWFTRNIVIDEEGVATVEAQLALPAPQATIYAVLTDYPHWQDLFPGHPVIHDIRTIDDRVRVTMHIPAGYLPFNLNLVTDTVGTAPLRLDTTLVQGDFKRYDWTWDLSRSPSATSTVARLRLHVAPSIWVPNWMLRWMLQSELTTHFQLLRERVSARHQTEHPSRQFP